MSWLWCSRRMLYILSVRCSAILVRFEMPQRKSSCVSRKNGASAYIFCSEEVLERTINQTVEEALYERECLEAIERGEEAIERGDCMCGLDNLKKRATAVRNSGAFVDKK